jgi:hypothetical protein
MSKASIIRAKLAEGKTQMEVAKELNICQSSVSYHNSKMSRYRTHMRQYFNYRIRRCSMPDERIVIYKRNDLLYMTNESNYNARIQDRSKISVLADFSTFDEVIHYMKQYVNTDGIEFVDRTGGEKV